MEDGALREEGEVHPIAPHANKPVARKFRDIVELYMRNRLPRDLHPSFEEIGHTVSTGPRPALHTSSQTEPKLETKIRQDFEDEASVHQNEDETPEELYEEAESEEVRFCHAAASYERVADAKYKTHITVQGLVHTWDEVLDEVNHVAHQYKDSSTFWGKIRKGLRKFGENHRAFDAWLGLLPTQSHYLSTLCGGLKLVIRAAGRLAEIRESICDALAEIPVLLNNTKLILGAFKKSKELHRCSSMLYVTTLAALEHIVTWYQQKASKKTIKSLFKQEGYERALTEKIKAIKTASDRFAEAAKICSYQKQDSLDRQIRQTRNEVQHNRLIIERSRSESADNNDCLAHVVKAEAKETRQDMEVKLAMLESNNAELRGQMASDNVELRNRMDALLECFLSSNDRINPKTHNLREPLLPIELVATRTARLKKNRICMQEEVLSFFAYEESVTTSDIKSMLRIAWTLPKAAQDRAVSLMQSLELHAWIKSPESSILFVNGNYDVSARQSPLSFVCAKLMDSVKHSSNGESQASSAVFTHGFFCGLHLNSKGRDGGVGGMVRSLLGQLLVVHSTFDLPTMELLKRVDQTDLKALCEIYFRLIMQLPARVTVLCTVDGITFHEDSRSRRREALRTVQTMVRLTENCDGEEHCIFKVLFTCPGTSRSLYKEIAKEDVLWLPKRVRAQGGFTSMKWSASVGKDVDELVME